MHVCFPASLVRFSLILMGAIATSLALGGRAIATTVNGVCPAQLGERLEALINRPQFQRNRWGVLVQNLETGESLYERESQRFFIPASSAKLLTTAAALTQFGPAFRLPTAVYQLPSTAEATVLSVVGRGDPTVTDEHLRTLARQLRQRGITQVDRLIGNDSAFAQDALNPTWDWDDIQAGYGAAANGLILNGNAIALTLSPQAVGQPVAIQWGNPLDAPLWPVENQTRTVAASEPASLRVGWNATRTVLQVQGQMPVGAAADAEAIAVPEPAQYFIRRFRQILAGEGIAVRQVEVSLENSPEPPTSPLAAIASPSLAELLMATNQDSENLYAESLLRQLGQVRPLGDRSSPLDAGVVAVETILSPLGVDPQSFRLADGSGLSRQNLVSPAALNQTLRAMARSPHAAVFRNSLAVAGVSGTLRNRLRDTAMQGRLWGKTGALGGVAALSGYVEPPGYAPLVVTILVNGFEQPVRTVRPTLDEMVLLLGQLQPCE